MNKKIQKILVPVLIAMAAVGALWGGLVLYRNLSRGSVNVYQVSDFAMTDYYGDSSEAYGMVTTDKLQNVPISETQTVTEIYVTEGQEVHVGDPLIAFDTTLSEIDLEKAQINVQKLQLQYENAQNELETLKHTSPGWTRLVTPETTVTFTPHETPALLAGTGNSQDPYVYLWDENDSLSMSFLQSLAANGKTQASETEDTGDAGEAADDSDETEDSIYDDPSDTNIYVALIVRYNNALNGMIEKSWGLRISADGNSFSFCDPVLSEEIQAYDEEAQPYYEYGGSGYTAADLAKLRNEKAAEIADLELQIRLAQVELEKKQQEVSDGVVYSKLDGVVKTVRDPDECRSTGESVISVSAGGGYYIEVAMTELELDTMKIGQTVTVNSWQTGMQYEGTVVAISEYPTTNSNSWTSGNTNVSYYPFTVFVDESADLQEYSYVDIQYTSAEDSGDSWYLENMFIRTEGGKSFVYVEGADGKLEQRTVQTGKSIWSEYTEIRGGITLEDRIAFPYGNDVVSGASVNEATADEFYSSY